MTDAHEHAKIPAQMTLYICDGCGRKSFSLIEIPVKRHHWMGYKCEGNVFVVTYGSITSMRRVEA